ncbi:MAG: GH25 family lysozyme, partial [Coriobacteriales bacterium]|nr:GH25 family lysozyme [Coriobacteriales bacterium]
NAKKQYDVYYRTYLQNVGWTSWAKNGESSGAIGFGYGIQQIQIRLRKKTVQALTGGGDIPFACLGDTDITYSSRALNGSWQNPRADGATCGTVGKSGRIDLIRANLPASDEYGITYSVSNNANAWQAWKSDGEIAGQAGQNLTAIRFKLTGILTTYYDIWYRAHIANVGWLGWTRNGAAAGSDSDTTPVEAFQIQLRPKGAAAPGSTQTAYKIARQLNGVDISGWNEGINISKLDADFVIIKATEGVQGTIYNPWYKSWADKALADGKLIGFYHYANGGDPIKEADCFYNAIAEFKGRAVACLDWEGQGNPTFDTGKDVAWCKKFLNRLKSRYGGTPLLYTSKNYTNAYDWSSVAASYPLWGAEYPDFKDVNGYQSDPWQSSRPWGAWGKNPLIFQYTSTGVLLKNGGIEHFDFNLFYGTVGDWKALLK